MEDNIPTTIIKNIPPFITAYRGNDGRGFILPPSIVQYDITFLAQETLTIVGLLSTKEPITQENNSPSLSGDYILI